MINEQRVRTELRLSTFEQKENRLTICRDFKNRSADDNFLKKITLSRVTKHGFTDPETKFQLF